LAGEPLEGARLCRAQALGYGLLAELLREGPSERTREGMLASPALQEGLRSSGGELEPLQVDHEHAFGRCVFPYEGTFLDAEGRVGADRSARLALLFEELELRLDPRGEALEHLSSQLLALATLSEREAEALEAGRAHEARAARAASARLLEAHLLRWLPIFAHSIRRLGRAYPSALVDQIEALVRLQWSSIAGASRASGSEPASPPERAPALEAASWSLSGEGLSIDDPALGLGEIAAFLATPSRSGIFLSRDDLAELGRAHRVPRGFGSRTQTLEALLRSSSHLDAFGPLLEDLRVRLERSLEPLEPSRYAELPAALLEPWRARLREAIAWLQELGRRAATLEHGSEPQRRAPR